MADGEVLVLCQDMTITRAAFLRSLPAAVDGAAFTTVGTAILHIDNGRSWRIALDVLPALALGALRLERHRVRIYLTGYDERATQRFLQRFELYFRRAGG